MASSEDHVPLSLPQSTIAVDQMLYGDAPVYLVAGYYVLPRISVERLESALSHVLERHESLRTSLTQTAQGLRQRFSEISGQVLALIDCGDGPEGDQRARDTAIAEAKRPIPLFDNRLFRFTLCRGSSVDVWSFSFHHVAVDGYGVALFVREVVAVYHGLPLEAPPRFRAFIEEDHSYATSPAIEADREFWRAKLKDRETESLFPPVNQTRYDGSFAPAGRVAVEIPREAFDRLVARAKEGGYSFLHLSLGALACMLAPLTRSGSVTIGVALANRHGREARRLCAHFANVIPIAIPCGPSVTFEQLLATIRTELRHCYRHQRLPSNELLRLHSAEAGEPEGLFEIAVSYLDLDMQIEIEGGSACLTQIDAGFEKLPLFVAIRDFQHTRPVELSFLHNLAHLGHKEVEAMSRRFLHTLEGFVVAPQRKLEEIDGLPPQERTRLAELGDGGAAPAVSSPSLAALVSEQAARTPQSPALVCEGEQWTYAELERQAGRIASALVQAGLGVGSPVVVCARRGLESVAAILGVWRCGATYVPVEASTPEDRLQFILDDCKAAAVLTEADWLHRFDSCGHPVLSLKASAEPCFGAITNPPALDAGHDAYLIYTSGSTGRPKGVRVAQATIIRHILAMREVYALRPSTTVLQFASFAFDASLEVLFAALSCGGRVVVRGDAVWTAAELHEVIARHKIEVINLPPAYLAQWVQGWPSLRPLTPGFPSLVISGGDVLAPTVALPLVDAGLRLLNAYGPTECTITATLHEVTREDIRSGRMLPIGKPLPGRKLSIRGPRGHLLPFGSVGELHVGGPLLAEAYQGWNELTRERFVDDPETPAQRLYRTGDLCRWREDGCLEFFGRQDDQIKINGFRIELGEIEAAARSLPTVTECAVLICREGAAARLVLHYSGSLEEEELREKLSRMLPVYMVPPLLYRHARLPLTPSGKMDRTALRTLQARTAPETKQSIADTPLNDTENKLSRLWCELLNRETASRSDDFILLGGDSLLAIRMALRIQSEFGVAVTLRDILGHPQLAELAALIEQIRLKPAATERAEADPGKEDLLPLCPSQAQRRLWFVAQLEGRTATFNMPGALRLSGILNQEALSRALAALVERHEVLRYRFPEREGEPTVLLSPDPFELEVTVAEGLTPAERERAVADSATREARHVFDLAESPLFRARLLRFSTEDHVLLLNMHHIVCDDWSMDILLRELSALYAAFSRGVPSTLSPLKADYRSYARQDAMLTQAAAEEPLAYWKDALSGAPPLLLLPTDRPRPRTMRFIGRQLNFEFDAVSSEGMRGLARRHRTTLFTAMLASFAVLLHRHSRQNDLVVGTPVANRTRPGTEEMVGLFVNVLPLRLKLDGSQSFDSLLAEVHARTMEAFAHSEAPFELLVETLSPRRELSYTPLFQVMFDLLPDRLGVFELDGLSLTELPIDYGVSKYDLSVTLKDRAGALFGSIEYSTDLFDEATISRMADHYRTLVSAIVSSPAQSIAVLPLMSKAEKSRTLALSRPAVTASLSDYAPVISLFEAQVRTRADAECLVYREERLTFGELDARASVLAGKLKRTGAGPGSRIGLFLDYSPDVVTAILAVLKVGAAYIPLDREDARFRLMLRDAAPMLIVTRSEYAGQLMSEGIPFLKMDEMEEAEPVSVAGVCVAAEIPAYILYTSGSTGTPKGVVVSNGSLYSVLSAWSLVYSPGPSQTFLLSANHTFDVFTGDLVRSLCNGARLVMCPREWLLDAPELCSLIRREAVTFAELVPVVLRQLIAELQAKGERLETLKTLICGSDAWHAHEGQAIRALCPSARIFNSYGVTEATIDNTFFEIGAMQAEGEKCLPIGRPLPHTDIFILDALSQPLPVGIPGELVLGGPAIAEGYLGKPELTAERFVAAPADFASRGARLYRTGDLCCWKADGNIEFLGRLDHQVKVRGFRVELAEVEKALSECAGVSECAVVARPDSTGETALIAYFRGSGECDAARTFLRQRLPAHMIPTRFMRIERFALTSSGKIDRKALPHVEAEDKSAAGTAPRDDIERRMVRVWAGVLGTDKIGVHDDFFSLGGHSLLAAKLVASLQLELSRRIPLSTLFRCPTVAQLAQALGQLETVPGSVPLATGIERQRLSFAQRRLWFLNATQVEPAAYNVPDVVRLRGTLDIDALEVALQELVARHEALRSRFSATVRSLPLADGLQVEEPVREVQPPPTVALPLLDLSRHPELAMAVLEKDARTPIDLFQGPPYRFSLLRLGPTEHILSVVIHHIATDGQSSRVFWDELSRLYADRLNGRPFSLPKPALQDVDFATYQRRLLEAPAFVEHLDFWRSHLAEFPEELSLHTDAPRSTGNGLEGESVLFEIAPDLSRRLEALCKSFDCSLFMLLHAGFAALLHRHSGQEDFVIGAPFSGRELPEFESVIGCLINLLPLRLKVDATAPFAELLKAARQVSAAAQAHQAVPFDVLVERLQPKRTPGRHPFFDVMLVLQEDDGAIPTLPGLGAEPLHVDLGKAKLDLLLAVQRGSNGFRCLFEYRKDLFKTASIERLQRHFQRLLGAIAENPYCSIAALDMLTPAETRWLLHDCNDTVAPFESETCLHELIERQVGRLPEKCALELGELRLSYAEMWQAAERVAIRLVADCGIAAGDCIGLLLGSHPAMTVAMLAVMRTGAAYTPLDVEAPLSRVRTLAAAARCKGIICHGHTAKTAAELGLPVLNIEGFDRMSEKSVDRTFTPRKHISADLVANIIFTSGSTGTPKGVAVVHRALANLTRAIVKHKALTESTRQLQSLAPHFDAALLDLIIPLAAGGTIVFADKMDRLPGPPLLQLLRQKRITHLNVTPSMLQAMPLEDLPELAVLTVGGEACPEDLAARWAKGRRLINGYGPTETSVCVSATSWNEEGNAMVLRPIENTRFHVLDRSLNLLPVGVPGELCIAGEGVALGYVNDADLTSKVFIRDPFDPSGKGRLYRTGDRVVRLEDGSLKFLGRLDAQVKIRGVRVEPGEIEAALCSIPGVREGAVSVLHERSSAPQLVAFAVGSLDAKRLGAALRERLPAHMIPAQIICLDALPRSSTGKLDRKALPGLVAFSKSAQNTMTTKAMPGHEARVAGIWKELLRKDEIGVEDNFFDVGGHSILVAALQQRLEERLGVKVPITAIFEHPTIRAQARLLSGAEDASGSPTAEPSSDATPQEENGRAVAIIGMAGRFPGASSLDEFWGNLLGGHEAVTFYTHEELLFRGVDPALLHNPHYVKSGIPLDGIDLFDAAFFGYTPREAQLLDPQHRLFLECAHEALENAGYGSAEDRPAVGVYASASISHYLLRNLMPQQSSLGADPTVWLTGNDKDFLPTRTAYALNLRGPAVSVGTACSSSLVAVHFAVAALRRGECEMALAGGCSLEVEHSGYLYQEGGILSPDGRCHAFDERARGTSSGSGCAIVLLKPLRSALDDRDPILAVIKGSAINNDGSAKIGYTAPSIQGQSSAIKAALQDAQVSPDSIGYVETHGTGTPLGDPIEIQALTQAYTGPGQTFVPHSCALGALKANIGHLDAASGAAGLMKAVLALRQGQIPPIANFATPNPAIDFASGPFFVPTRTIPWTRTAHPRRAAISSFGIGGTNVHLVLEEAPAPAPAPQVPLNATRQNLAQIIPVSARSASALVRRMRELAEWVGANNASLDDAAWTLQLGRTHFSHRAAVVCDSASEARTRLLASIERTGASSTPRKPVFVFSGQGSQHLGMARMLYREEAIFRAHVDTCARLLAPSLGLELSELIYAPASDDAAASRLRQTKYAQPALFVVEYALARLLMEYGLIPEALVGHSIGEYVAACLAGVFTLEDALKLVTARGALMQEMPPGAMLAVLAEESRISSLLRDGLDLAAVNGPGTCVLSGSHENIARAEAVCQAEGLPCRRLETSHAFHSALMESAAQKFQAVFAGITASAPRIPIASNLTGAWLTDEQAKSPAYWSEQLRHTVRFGAAVSTVMERFEAVWFEVGPNHPLSDLLRRSTGAPVYPVLPKANEADDALCLKEALAGAWVHGAKIAWRLLHRGLPRRRLALPSYPFERTSAWLAAPKPFSAPPALVRSWMETHDGGVRFRLTIPHDHWLVAEHRVFDGRPVLPGTGCLDIVRQAYASLTHARELELRDVYFLLPLVLQEDKPQEARLNFTPLSKQAGGYAFVLSSDVGTHAQGEVGPMGNRSLDAEAPDVSTAGLRETPVALLPSDSHRYGPRWHCLDRLWLSEDRGLAHLALASDFAGDLSRHALHPALLDVATAYLSLNQENKAALPFHYQRLILRAPLPARFWSRARKTGTLRYDIALFEDGDAQAPRVLAEIQGYTLKAAAMSRGPDDWCRQPLWLPSSVDAAPPSMQEPWLVFAAASMPFELPPGSVRAIPGTDFKKTGHDAWSLRPHASEDFRELFLEISRSHPLLTHVVFAWPLDKPEPSVFINLIQRLAHEGRPLRLTVLTRGALRDGAVDAAAVAGMLSSVTWEFPQIRCRHLDLQAHGDTRALRGWLELGMSRPFSERASARPELYRIAEAGLETLAHGPLPPRSQHDFCRDGEVWLVTGGLGGIGLALAEHLAGRATLHLVLLSRSGEPVASDPRCSILERLRLRSASLTLLKADVSRLADMERALSIARKLGPLGGVIHAAGLEASGLLESLTPARMQAVFDPKIEGGKILHQLLLQSPPRKILLCSSLASLLGGLGQADYTAANAALDALAHAMRVDGLPATSIQWDAWSETGMAHRFARTRETAKGAAPDLAGLTTAEGCAVFDRILETELPQVVVSKQPLEKLLSSPTAEKPLAGGSTTRALNTPYVAPTSELERELAAVWKEVLGVEKIGIHDSFYELGGHSLLATQVVSRIRDRHGKVVTLAEFLEHPTVAFLARRLEAEEADILIDSQDREVRYCVQPLQLQGRGKPFFCVPGMGGNVAQLTSLSKALGRDRPFIAFQSLGLDGKAQPHRSAESMASHYLRCLRAVQPRGPYLLGGHSLGSKVAWEMAHQLQLQGESVSLLVHIDSAAPPYRESGAMDDAAAVGSVLNIYAHIYGKPLDIGLAEYERLKTLELSALFEYLKDRLSSAGIIRREADDGSIRGLVNVFKATSEFRYNPKKEAGPFPSLLFKAMDPMPHSIQLPEIRENDTWGWEQFTTLRVEVVEVPGDHFSCLAEANVASMAATLRARLREADPV